MWNRFVRLNHRHVLPDLVIIISTLYLSLYIRLGERFAIDLGYFTKFVPIFLILHFGCLVAFGIYEIIWRYFSLTDAMRLLRTVAFSTVLTVAATYMVDTVRVPRSTFIINFLLLVICLGGIRVIRRVRFKKDQKRTISRTGRPTLIYGAGVNGRMLAERFQTDPNLGFNLIGFIDDSLEKVGRQIAGVKVLGNRETLPQILAHYPIEELVISPRNMRGEEIREILQIIANRKVRLRRINDLLTARATETRTDTVRSIDLSDLLNRPRSTVDFSTIRSMVEGRRILVTGAGGSIGSEVSRQVLSLNPGRLLLLDHSEFNLYQIDQELRSRAAGNQVVPLLVDIKDRNSVAGVFRDFVPEVVFHAAAYKHVHLVEGNPHASILNNVQGTQNLLEACESTGVQTFVLISTDKAVNPAGIMGATKRVCEMLVSAAGRRTGNRYCSVRFGNVLGSSGSLIPLLQKQLHEGRPLTITHRDMTRYFMLIPEAVSLVLKAATAAQPGDIMILRMGDPVKILDIAKALIALMGKREEEVEIQFTGLRPGEKMFEELYLCGNEVKTEDPDILVLPKGDGLSMSEDTLDHEVARILAAAAEQRPEAIIGLKTLIQSATPGARSGTTGASETAKSTSGIVELIKC